MPVRLPAALARRRAGLVIASVALTTGLVACSSDDSSSATTAPVASAEDLAQAQVSGDWAVTLTIDTLTPPALDERIQLGDTLTRRYVLATGCDVPDTVDCKVARESGVGTSSEVWTRKGATLTYHVVAPVTVACVIDGTDTPTDYTATVDISLEVTDAVQVGDDWIAKTLDYKRSAQVQPGPDAEAKGCKAGTQTESGSGTPAAPAAPPTTAATATTGATQTTGS